MSTIIGLVSTFRLPLQGAGLGLDCGMLIVLAMYLSGLLGKIKARREMKRKYNCK